MITAKIFRNFDTARKDANEKITALLAKIQRQIAYRYADPRSLGQKSAIRFVPIVFARFAGFEGEYWAIFNRKTRETGGNRRYKDGGETFVPSS